MDERPDAWLKKKAAHFAAFLRFMRNHACLTLGRENCPKTIGQAGPQAALGLALLVR